MSVNNFDVIANARLQMAKQVVTTAPEVKPVEVIAQAFLNKMKAMEDFDVFPTLPISAEIN